jgi:hypothetical protein
MADGFCRFRRVVAANPMGKSDHENRPRGHPLHQLASSLNSLRRNGSAEVRQVRRVRDWDPEAYTGHDLWESEGVDHGLRKRVLPQVRGWGEWVDDGNHK